MRGTVDPAPRCRTAKASRALQPGEDDGLAKFAAEIEYGTSSRELQWTFAGVAWPPGRRGFSASAATDLRKLVVKVYFFLLVPHTARPAWVASFPFIEAGQTIQNQYNISKCESI
jgi:hypothetical protein